MHDVGMNMEQLAMTARQIDDVIELARTWSHDLCHAAEAHQMDRTAHKLEQTLQALGEARAALEGYEDAIERDHNSAGSVRLV